MISKRSKGYIYEKKVAAFLATQGYTLIASNYTIRGGEIDLIFKQNEEIVFVEVKGFNFATPYDIYSALNRKKLLSLKRSINKWLLINGKQDAQWRLDFVIVLKKNETHKIEHYKNVDINTGSF